MKSKKQSKNQQGGYTLIELLVVMSIISLLSSSILVVVRDARINARDARRAEDLRQAQRAIQFFYDDYKIYPNCAQPLYNGSLFGGCDSNIVNADGTHSIADTSADNLFMTFTLPYTGNHQFKDPINIFPFEYAYEGSYDWVNHTNIPYEYPLGSGRYVYYVIGGCLEKPNNPAVRSSLIYYQGTATSNQCPVFGE